MTLRERIDAPLRTLVRWRRDRRWSALERKRTGFAYEPAAHREDPFPHYTELRERDPVHHHPRLDGLVLTRHEDCRDALRDPRLSSDNRRLRVFPALREQQLRDGGNAASFDNPSLLNLDAPEHTRLRGLVSRGFTPRAITNLAPRLESIANELLDGFDARISLDWMETMANPLPAIAIAELLGIPKGDRERFLGWSAEILAGGPLQPRAQRKRAIRANAALVEYFVEIAQLRRHEPGPDILSSLLRVEAEEGDRLTFAELIATCSLLLLAGHAGTSAMIGNGLLALMRHPEQLARLRDQPELWPTAIEEMLRFDGAIHSILRIAKEDLRIHGKRLKKGQTAVLVIAAANRDPEAFDSPNEFDIARSPNEHLSFGHGRHFCLGASLARLEIRVALQALLNWREETPRLAAPALRWKPNDFRSLESLPLVWARAETGPHRAIRTQGGR